MSSFIHRSAPFAFALVALVASLGTGADASAAELRKVSERVIPFSAGGTIHLENKNGSVTVEGWSRPEVRLQITRTVRVGDKRRAEELMKELRSDVEVRGERLDIVSRYPKRVDTVGLWDVLGNKVASLSISYVLQVPIESDVSLTTTNGGVRARGLDGRLDASTTNGAIHARRVAGAVRLSTTNGEVELSDMAGSATVRTTNGSVTARVNEVKPGGAVALSTTNGNVDLYVPSGLEATLDAVTTNGRVSVDFPLTTQGVVSSKRVRGTINGGGVPVSLSTTNGNVDVRRVGERKR